MSLDGGKRQAAAGPVASSILELQLFSQMTDTAPRASVEGGTGSSPLLRLGINTCFAVKRWPEPSRWVPIVVGELGLTDCQLSLDLLDPGLDPDATASYAHAVRDEAIAAGLHLHSTFTGLSAYAGNLLMHPDAGSRREAEAWFRRAIDVTAAVGAGGTGGFLGAMSVVDAADDRRRELLVGALASSMTRLSAHAHARGLEFLLFENMAVQREYGHLIEEALALEAVGAAPGAPVPWVLCLDLGHPCALRTGTPSDDPLRWIRTDWRNPPVLQIQQANRDGDHHWPFTDLRNAQGLLDATAVVRTLRSRPPANEIYLFLEVIHPHEYPDDRVIDDLHASVRHWRAAISVDEANRRGVDGQEAETGSVHARP